jgi:hypothetical protein
MLASSNKRSYKPKPPKMIIQTKASKNRCQSTPKLVQTLEDLTRLCASATATAESLVQSKESALCANSRDHLHLHLRSVRSKRSLSQGLPSTPDGATALHESIMARPQSRPHCAMPPSLNVVNVLETNTAPPRNQPQVPRGDVGAPTGLQD